MTGPDGATHAAGPHGAPSGMADLVAVMDRLRSPGGCPWDAEQTHASLLPYAIEEVFEVVEAVEHGDRADLREELGDLLLQVVFHARLAQEHPDDPFDLDDVARGTAAKLRRRHPHVFAAGATPDAEGLHRQWDAIKQDEKQRASAFDGIPAALPALARAHKVLGRAQRAGLDDVAGVTDVDAGAGLGERLLALVAEAQADGVDAEHELRAAVRALEGRLRAAEAARSGVHGVD
ncbi:MazG family protein [Cellulomonas sp. APG4]|uniref:MazG family protein n=1 Tax=Cellulomonas sp. APG4 TaxID=1538656 RepID=UPI00351B40D2